MYVERSLQYSSTVIDSMNRDIDEYQSVAVCRIIVNCIYFYDTVCMLQLHWLAFVSKLHVFYSIPI